MKKTVTVATNETKRNMNERYEIKEHKQKSKTEEAKKKTAGMEKENKRKTENKNE